MKHSWWQRPGLALIIGIIGLAAGAFQGIAGIEETVALDWLFDVRGPIQTPSDVVIVSIDGESATALGLHTDPDRWPRSLHATLIERLSAAGAALIVFDIIFDAPRDAIDDRRLGAALREAQNVILLERLRTDSIESAGGVVRIESRVPPLPEFRETALATAPFPLPLVPVKVSQFWAFGPSDEDVPTLPTIALHGHLLDIHDDFVALLEQTRPNAGLAFARRNELIETSVLSSTATKIRALFRSDRELAAALMTALEPQPGTENLKGLPEATRTDLATLIRLYAGSSSRYLNFYGPTRTIETLPYYSVVADGWEPSPAKLAGKTVFVGFSEPRPIEQQDTFFTAFSDGSGTRMSGVEIGATAFANQLAGTSIRLLPAFGQHLVILVWGTLFASVLIWLPTRPAFVIAAILVSAYLFVAVRLFEFTEIWAPLAVPMLVQVPLALLAVLAWKYACARIQGDRARRSLRFYLPPQVVEQLTRESGEARATTQLLHGTCMVTDAAQYTALSENMNPKALHSLLNDYYSVLFSEVERFDGFVTDVVGDSMVAVWSSTEPDSELRTNACRAADAILNAVDLFNQERTGLQLPTRIGLHSGEVLLGNVGAESHFEYRAIGDIVNTATRIQGLNKRLGTVQLISEDVLKGIPSVHSRFVGEFLLAGKSIALRLHDRVRIDESSGDFGMESILITEFSHALQSFRQREWQIALREFQQILNKFPLDGPSRFYLSLCQTYLAAEPGPEWRGTIAIAEK